MSDSGAARSRASLVEGGEAAFTVLLLLFSAFLIWQSTQVSEPPRNISVGPRTFPLIVGWMMFAVSMVLVWQQLRRSIRKSVGNGASTTLVPQEEEETSISDWPAVWIVLGSLLALCLLLEPLGFVATLSLFLFGLSTFFAARKWMLNLGASVAFGVFFYWLFTRVLEIPLPNGILSAVF